MGPPTVRHVQTDRLRLRPWRIDEADRLFDIRRRPEVAEWLADPTPWTDVAEAEAAIDAWAHTIESEPPMGSWAIEPLDGRPIAGWVVLRSLPDGEVDIGWTLHPDSTGHGWASEAAALLLERARSHGVLRVWAIMWPHNDASAAVASAIGMTDLGVMADPWYGTEQDPDSRIFRIEWPEATP